MVWDVGNDVGLNKISFSCIILFALSILQFFIGELGVSHCGPILGRAALLGGGTTITKQIDDMREVVHQIPRRLYVA